VTWDRPCRQCGADTEAAFRVGDLNRHTGPAAFRYERCANCGTVFLVDAPADLTPYYPPEYYTIARSVEELATWAVSERYKIEIIQRFRKSGHLIEIGPASGGFCYLAKEAGFDVAAIEMDRRSCEFLSTELGIGVVESADEAAALEGAQPADVIAMWHVIEHLVDPWSMLEVAARKLRPGGVLVLATPNPRALQFAILGRRWAHVDAPRHLWLLPARVIAERATGLGLTVRLLTTRDPGSLGWNRFGWEHTLMNRFAGRAPRRVAAKVGRLLAAALYPLESREGRGAAYTIVLQKPGQ
jgi:SAM-dependent methyltransferase